MTGKIIFLFEVTHLYLLYQFKISDEHSDALSGL